MSNNTRAKKPTTKRNSPDRNSGLFRDPQKSNGAAPEEHDADPVMQAYRVMEEQMRQGALGALNAFKNQTSYFTGAGFMPNLNAGNANAGADILSQWANLYTQMLNLGMQSIESVADLRTGKSDSIPYPSNNANHSRPSTPFPDVESTALSPLRVEIHCKRAAEVLIDMRTPPTDDCRVQPLQNVDGDNPPLSKIKFETLDGVVALHVTVPRTSKKGIYVGAVINKKTNTGCGTITVKL